MSSGARAVPQLQGERQKEAGEAEVVGDRDQGPEVRPGDQENRVLVPALLFTSYVAVGNYLVSPLLYNGGVY